jgi:hypothetical protein
VEERAFRPASSIVLIFVALKAPLLYGTLRDFSML